MTKKEVVFDTNVIQALFMILHEKNGVENLEKCYNTNQIMSLLKLSKNLDKYTVYVTAQIFNEVKMCESKHPGIIKFMATNCKIKIPYNYRDDNDFTRHIVGLQKEYLEKDIPLPDSTRNMQQAICGETKKGVPNYADPLIIAEKNIITGLPFFTLNEQHLVCMNEADNKTFPYRSYAIIFKNSKYLKSKNIDYKTIKANLKKEHATTYRLARVFDKDLKIK